jgi:hypothetical protein
VYQAVGVIRLGASLGVESGNTVGIDKLSVVAVSVVPWSGLHATSNIAKEHRPSQSMILSRSRIFGLSLLWPQQYTETPGSSQ